MSHSQKNCDIALQIQPARQPATAEQLPLAVAVMVDPVGRQRNERIMVSQATALIAIARRWQPLHEYVYCRNAPEPLTVGRMGGLSAVVVHRPRHPSGPGSKLDTCRDRVLLILNFEIETRWSFTIFTFVPMMLRGTDLARGDCNTEPTHARGNCKRWALCRAG